MKKLLPRDQTQILLDGLNLLLQKHPRLAANLLTARCDTSIDELTSISGLFECRECRHLFRPVDLGLLKPEELWLFVVPDVGCPKCSGRANQTSQLDFHGEVSRPHVTLADLFSDCCEFGVCLVWDNGAPCFKQRDA